MTITITLTSAGLDSGPFDLYTNATGSFTLMESGVNKNILLAGYTVTTLDGTTVVRVQSTGTCTNYEDINVQTTTTTEAPTTTTSVASIVVGYSDLNNTTACSNYETFATTKYIPAGEDWQTVTAIYLDPIGTPAQAGYYSDGAKWHYWNESYITSTGFC
jgi:hypothetical protein